MLFEPSPTSVNPAQKNGTAWSPKLPLIFAVLILANTDEGDTFTLPEYREWLEADWVSRYSHD